MYHIVYLTTNIINNKIYVGKRTTKNLDDGYIGSGKILKQAILKYGKHNFKREILYHCLSKYDTAEIEAKIVDRWFVNRNDTYNVMLGGTGGGSLLGRFHTEESKQKISNSHKGKKRPPFTEETKKRMAEARKHQIRPITSDETKFKISEANKARNHIKRQMLQ